MSKASNKTATQSFVERLAKMCITRPEEAVRQILSDDCIEQDLRALRAYPAALFSLWSSGGATKTIRQRIEAELEEVGIEILT